MTGSLTQLGGELSARDRCVVELVGRFRQLTPKHLHGLVFADNASTTPLDRTLKRLVERSYLVRLERLVGGHRGGSAQFVYQLGRAGWKLLGRHGAYWAPRAVNLHALAVADCRLKLEAAARRGELEVVSFTTEPDCHRVVGHLHLTPDAHVELVVHGEKLSSWLEVDRGSEHLQVIREKGERYWQAYVSGQWDGDIFPYVLFVVPDEQRQHSIRQVIREGPDGVADLLSVVTSSRFPGASPQVVL